MSQAAHLDEKSRMRDGNLTDPRYQAFEILHWGFVAAPLLAGADKFTNLLTHWGDLFGARDRTPVTLRPARDDAGRRRGRDRGRAARCDQAPLGLVRRRRMAVRYHFELAPFGQLLRRRPARSGPGPRCMGARSPQRDLRAGERATARTKRRKPYISSVFFSGRVSSGGRATVYSTPRWPSPPRLLRRH